MADTSEATIPAPDLTTAFKAKGPHVAHPSGKEGYGRTLQILRGVAFMTYFFICTSTIFVTQLIGSPLYFVNKEWFYAYMNMTKRYFSAVCNVMTQIWGPTTLRISGDESVAGQIKPTRDGGVEFFFPERIVMIANHQIYTDWLYLWWVGYANQPQMHGHLYIILKESLRYLPIVGWGMMFYGFIFMSRKMATDQPRIAYRLRKLSQEKKDPRGRPYHDPMWLMLFPEGTNLSDNGRIKSAQWAKKQGLKDPEHLLLPRSTGMYFVLNELKGTLEYVYDCTVAYEGVPRGKFGEDLFDFNSTYFQGRAPKSVNFYWRRFKLDDIPLDNQEEFDVWLRAEWYKKDQLMEQYVSTGRFPAMAGSKFEFVETAVKTRSPLEILQVFSVVGTVGLIWHNVQKVIQLVNGFFG